MFTSLLNIRSSNYTIDVELFSRNTVKENLVDSVSLSLKSYFNLIKLCAIPNTNFIKKNLIRYFAEIS